MSKILVVDDDPDIILAVRMSLENVGHEVISASSGKEGLEKIKAELPDLVVLDVIMETPDEGIQLAKRLRNPDPSSELYKYREIPILMLTSIQSATPVEFDSTVDNLTVELFVDKPIDPVGLVGKVEWILKKKG
jgi:CheY-like chemotaxis protein